MAGRGRQVVFHGAFAAKADAVRKARAVGGFVLPFTVRGQKRYAVVTKKGARFARVNGRRRRNPLLAEYLNPPAVVGTIPGRLEEIRYIRTGRHAGPYKHRFDQAAEILALADGGLLIQPKKRGRKLWTDLPE